MTELNKLLDKIANDTDFQEAIIDDNEDKIREKADNYFKEFEAFYKTTERHRYSDLTKYLAEKVQDDRDHILEGIKIIVESAQKNDYDKDADNSDSRECYKKIFKLYDHIELEVVRLSSINKIKAVADSYDKSKKSVDDLLEEARETVKVTEKKAKSLSEQVISILGIFAGIIVTFSFATTAVGETLTNLAKSDVMYLGFVIALLGLIFINVITILMSFIGKLSGHKVSGAFPWISYILGNVLAIAAMIFCYCKM